MSTLDPLSISLGVLALVRFLGTLVFIDLFLQKQETKYAVLILGWLAVACGSAWGLYTHAVLGQMENFFTSLLAGVGTFWIGCGALLYFDAIRPRFILAGSILILLYGLLPVANINLGPSPGVIIQVLISFVVTFAVLFRRKTLWEFARSSYLWLVALAVLSDGLTIAFGVGIIGPENLPLGFAGTTFIHIVAIIFFLHLEYNLSTRRIRESENRYRILSAQLDERVAERTRELEEAQQDLIRQERLAVLGELASGVGHELRNPLGVISNAIYYLNMAGPETDAKIQEHLRLIDTETKNATKIINDLLDFGRIKSADRSPTQVIELVNEGISRYPAPENVTISVDIPSDLQPVLIDSQQIKQVLGNLVANAYQAMPDGGILTLTARKNQNEIEISLSDTGMGIPSDQMEKLFEPLFTTKTSDIGLGLAISKKLVEANEGTIVVESVAGEGSTFIVRLPSA